jgi:hypothetical protein
MTTARNAVAKTMRRFMTPPFTVAAWDDDATAPCAIDEKEMRA